MKNEPSKKTVITLGFVILVCFALFVLLFIDIRNKNVRASTLVRDTALQVEGQQYLIALKRTIENTSSDITRVKDSIIPSDGDVQFVEDLESTARAKGLEVTIDSLTFDDVPLATSSPDITAFKVKAEVKGSWSGVYTFLGVLESLPYKIKINTFNLVNTSDSGKSKSTVWQGTFEIIVLKYK